MQSSKFGCIIKCVSQEAKENLAKDRIDGKDFVSKQTSHGNQLEPDDIPTYENMFHVKVTKCGIVVSADKPYLGSSPDGLVGDDTVVEIKCPYSARNMLVTPQTVPYLKQHGTELKLDSKHDYYAQMKAQMWVTERNMCHFVVHTFKDTKVCLIPVDNSFIQIMFGLL